MARAERILRAACAALLFAAPLGAQQTAPKAVTLSDALKLSEQVQPAVIAAFGQVRSTEARVRSAKGAFLPSLSASSNGSRSFSEGPSRIDPVTQEVISGNSTNQSVSFGLSTGVTLFDGFRRNNDLRTARANQDAADANLVDAKFQNALTTTNAFFDALSAQQTLRVREASVRRAEEQLKVSVAKLQTGSATRSDSLRSLVQLGNARLQALQAQTTLATSEANLGRLIGSSERVAAVDDSALYRAVGAIDTTGLRAAANSSSPRVRNLDASVNAARASYSSSKAGYWPSLQLSAGTSWNGSQSNDYTLRQNRNLGLGLSWQIFNGFTREQGIAQAAVALDNAEATAAEARRQVQASLTQRLAELAAAREQVSISSTSVQAATEDVRVITERYKLGVATIVDVLTSQESLTQAEIDAVTARFTYLRAKAQIEALIGRSLQ